MSTSDAPPAAAAVAGPSAFAHAHANGSAFAPRREFLRDRHTFSTFALLALSGSGAIRLYGFPPAVVSAFRRFFHDAKTTTAFREDAAHAMSEFTIDGRPWAMAKNITTEKLIVDLMAVVFKHGYVFLSTIDYGREQDDRLAVAFSKPAMYGSSRPNSPDPGLPNVNGSIIPPPRTPRVPFAISFSSTTVLRVINPPLHSTPAILQAVRGSWPRGVVAEKKVAETCFEFKLKGYRWFQEDTFAQDSLHHILSLLAALDAYGFKLLSSITLTSRSRIKDLWIFTGPASDGSSMDSPPGSPLRASLELRRHETPEGSGGSSHSHGVRPVPSSSTPLRAVPPPPVNQSPAANRTRQSLNPPESPATVRSASRNSNSPSQNTFRSLLRKPAPRMVTSPSAATFRQDIATPQPPPQELFATLPSDVGSGVNMTGVGTARRRDDSFDEEEEGEEEEEEEEHEPDVFYETGAGDRDRREQEQERCVTPALTQILQDEDPFRRGSPPPIHPAGRSTPPTPSPYAGVFDHRPIPADAPRTPSPPHATPHSSALLGPGVFRDTAFSGSTGWRATGVDVPVTWFAPPGRESALGLVPGKHDSGVDFHDPPLPGGGWVRTPERGGGTLTPGTPKGAGYFPARGPGTPDGASAGRWAFPAPHQLERLEVESRVSMPWIADGAARKSEAAVIGLMAEPPVPAPVAQLKQQEHARAPSGDGWVLVDVAAPQPRMGARPRSGSDSLVPPAAPGLRGHAQDPWLASNTSLPAKEGTMRRLFSVTREPGSGNRIRKPPRAAVDAGRSFR